jgi:hypothetical protein
VYAQVHNFSTIGKTKGLSVEKTYEKPFFLIPSILLCCDDYFYWYDCQTQTFVNLIIGCLYVRFFGLHVSVILMTIIRSVRAKEIAMQQRFSLNVMGSHYVAYHCLPRSLRTAPPYYDYLEFLL